MGSPGRDKICRRQGDAMEDPITKAIQNALILDVISSHLSLSDVLKCRRVSVLWKQAWTAFARKKMSTQIDLTDDNLIQIYKYYKIIHPETFNDKSDIRERLLFLRYRDAGENGKELIKWITNSGNNFPCKSFKVTTSLFELLDQQTQDDFFLTISDYVAQLTIEINQGDFPLKWDTLGTSGVKFENLKIFELELSLGDVKNTKWIDLMISFFGNIIQQAPNLDTVHMTNFNDAGYVNSFINILHGKAISIKNLKLCGVINNQHLSRLCEMNMRLESLSFTFQSESQFTAESLKLLLEHQHETLEKLLISCKIDKSPVTLTFPPMNKLIVLEFDGLDNASLPEFDISQQFPVLKRITLKANSDSTLSQILNSKMQSLETVETLELLGIAKEPQISSAICMFPNVKKLSVICDCTLLQRISNVMQNPKFEEIMLVGSQVDLLKVINGAIPSEVTINGRSYMFACVTKPLETPLFQNVKVLRIESSHMDDEMCQPFLQLRSLMCLDLRKIKSKITESIEINQTTLQKMKAKFTVLLPD